MDTREAVTEAIREAYMCRNCAKRVGLGVLCGCDYPSWDAPTPEIMADAAIAAHLKALAADGRLKDLGGE